MLKARDVFTPDMVKHAQEIMKRDAAPYNAKLVAVVHPHMERINKFTGQENDVRYIAYMLEYVVMHHQK